MRSAHRGILIKQHERIGTDVVTHATVFVGVRQSKSQAQETQVSFHLVVSLQTTQYEIRFNV